MECYNCPFKEYIYTKKCKKMYKKSSAIQKAERNRFSVFTEDLEYCIICESKKDNLHEIFFGKNRSKSMKYGFVIPLCAQCHREMHKNHEWQEFWHKKAQLYYESHFNSRNDFIKEFGKNYIK